MCTIFRAKFNRNESFPETNNTQQCLYRLQRKKIICNWVLFFALSFIWRCSSTPYSSFNSFLIDFSDFNRKTSVCCVYSVKYLILNQWNINNKISDGMKRILWAAGFEGGFLKGKVCFWYCENPCFTCLVLLRWLL